MNKITQKEAELPVMMYIHGFRSGANGSKRELLQKHFEGKFRVVAPEVDADPETSLAKINEIIAQEHPQIIVGTSLGGWMTIMCESNNAQLVVVNPCLHPKETLSQWKDMDLEYFCPRLDGIQTLRLTDEILNKYNQYDVMRALKDKRESIYALCSTQDELLGTSHIDVLQPLLIDEHLTIADSFGHRCSGQGMNLLFKLLDEVDESQILEKTNRIMNMNSNRISSGLIGFDRITGGLALGQLITITGRPAMGKTAFAITLMMNIGLKQQIPVAFFSIEISNTQIGKRILKNWASDDFNISAENSEDIEQIDYKQLLYKLYKAPIFLDDTPIISIDEIEDKIVNHISKYGVKVVIIEYLQLIRGFDVIPDNIMKRLKAIALNHGICIITISQLYKDFYPLKPYDSDSDEDFFRGATKDIMNNSDLVVLLYRPAYYGLICGSAESQNIVEAIILKGKNEQIEIAPLTLLPKFPRFTDYIAEEADSTIKVVDVIRNRHELEEWQRKWQRKIGLI